MNTVHQARIREFRESDLVSVRKLIHQTIEVCYAGIYPPRAVQFFKDFHSDEKIVVSTDVGGGEHLDFWKAKKSLARQES